MLAAVPAGQHREEGVVVPPGVMLLALAQGQEQVHAGGRRRAVESDDHLIEAPQEEVNLGPQQRLAALLGRRTEDQVAEQFGVGLVALRHPPGRHPLRRGPRRRVEGVRPLQDLGAFEDVIVGEQVIE